MPRKKRTGILRWPGKKPKAYVAVYINGRRRQRAKRFDIGTPDSVLLAWIESMERQYAPAKLAAGSFAADVAAYLAKPKIAAMPSVDEKRAQLLIWIELLGADRTSESITSDEIEAGIQTMLTSGLADATVYHRRSALSSFFTTKNGIAGANPVRGTTRPEPWTPRDQSVDYATLTKILDAMPAERCPAKGIRQPSAARLVAEVLMHLGVRGCDLLKVRRPDVNWTLRTVQMPAGSKGKGTRPWTCRLTPEGVEAFRRFDAANLYGAFSPAAVSHSFKRACRRVLGRDTDVHLYCLRHSVGADLYRQHGDTPLVGRALGHAPGSRMAEQYSRGAHAEVDHAALEAMSAARRAAVAPGPVVPPVDQVLPKVLPRLVKAHKDKGLQRVS